MVPKGVQLDEELNVEDREGQRARVLVHLPRDVTWEECPRHVVERLDAYKVSLLDVYL